MIYALWWGGCSYSHGDMDTDLEVFTSVTAAGTALQDRYHSNGVWRQTFRYADGRTESSLLPSVDALTTQMDVYLYDPRAVVAPYPDVRLTLGPRLGVRRERY